MKEEWNSPLATGKNVHYSIEYSPDDGLCRITAQAQGNPVLHQAIVQSSMTRTEVEVFFRNDLMKEPEG